MLFPSVSEPSGDDFELFYSTRLSMVREDLEFFKSVFGVVDGFDGLAEGFFVYVNGERQQKVFSASDFARHIRQVEWLLKELEKNE